MISVLFCAGLQSLRGPRLIPLTTLSHPQQQQQQRGLSQDTLSKINSLWQDLPVIAAKGKDIRILETPQEFNQALKVHSPTVGILSLCLLTPPLRGGRRESQSQSRGSC